MQSPDVNKDCDLSEAQLQALAKSKGQWFLVPKGQSFAGQGKDTFLGDFQGIRFFDFEFPPFYYALTPNGSRLSTPFFGHDHPSHPIDPKELFLESVKALLEVTYHVAN